MRLIILAFISLSFVGFSQESMQSEPVGLRAIEVRLSLLDKSPQILLGSEEPIKLEMSGEMPIHFFQMLVNDKFIFDDGIYLSQVKEIAMTKPGFSSVFEARAAFTKPVVPNTKFQLDLAQMGIQLQFVNLNIEVFNDPEVEKAKTPTVEEQNLSLRKSYTLEMVIILLFLLVAFIIWLVYNKKRHERLSLLKRKKEWIELIKKAQSRRDFEILYANSDSWKNLLEIDRKSIAMFSELVLRNQYKESWSPELLNDVQDSHRKLIQSVEQQGGR